MVTKFGTGIIKNVKSLEVGTAASRYSESPAQHAAMTTAADIRQMTSDAHARLYCPDTTLEGPADTGVLYCRYRCTADTGVLQEPPVSHEPVIIKLVHNASLVTGQRCSEAAEGEEEEEAGSCSSLRSCRSSSSPLSSSDVSASHAPSSSSSSSSWPASP